MTHDYKYVIRVASLLLALSGVTHLNARLTRAGTSCNTLEFTEAYSSSVSPSGLRDAATGDFNGDGKMDAVVLNIGVSTAGIALGDGMGHIGELQRFNLYEFTAFGVAVGDFNSDGKLDIATGERYGRRVAILYGDGTGLLTTAAYFDTGFQYSYAVGGAADLNGDGRTDLVVANVDNNTIQILFNRRNRRMVFSAPYAVGSSPRGVVAADFNGDGKTDIAVANHDSGNVSVIPGIDGMGVFGAATNYNVGHLPYTIVAADFNSDGKIDLAVSSDEHVSILQNNGGGFNAPVDFEASGCDIATSLTVGDFNGDARLDIATATKWSGSASISVLLGTGTGNFLTALSYGPATGNRAVAAADFDGDGRADLISQQSDVLKLLSSKCATPSHKIDYDGDNKTDIAVWRPSEGAWYILKSSFNTLRVEQWGSGTLGDVPVPGDYDGDLLADLAVFRHNTGTWYIRNSSDGSTHEHYFGINGDKPVQGDYDGDLRTDIAIWRPADGSWFIQNSSDGSVRSQHWGRGDLGDQPVHGDYDFDGKTDIAVLRTAEYRWFIYNSSNGTMTDVVFGTTGDVPLVYSMGARADIAMWRTSNNTWYYYRAGGGHVSLHGNGELPVPGDYDGDGLIDAALMNTSTGTWFINRSGNVAPLSHQFGIAGDVPVSVPYVLDK